MLNDTSVASAGSYIRTCRRIRNSKKIATIRDFHQNICVNPTIKVCVLFFKLKFSVSFEVLSLKRSNFKILVQMVNPFGCTIRFFVLFLFLFMFVCLFVCLYVCLFLYASAVDQIWTMITVSRGQHLQRLENKQLTKYQMRFYS